MNEVDSSLDFVHNPLPLMTRLAIMWHGNRRLCFFVLERGGRYDALYDAIYLHSYVLCIWESVTHLLADWLGLAGLIRFGLIWIVRYHFVLRSVVLSGWICGLPRRKEEDLYLSLLCFETKR